MQKMANISTWQSIDRGIAKADYLCHLSQKASSTLSLSCCDRNADWTARMSPSITIGLFALQFSAKS